MEELRVTLLWCISCWFDVAKALNVCNCFLRSHMFESAAYTVYTEDLNFLTCIDVQGAESSDGGA